MKQLTIDFDLSVVSAYSRCTDYVAARVHQLGIPQKAVAADLDMSPSQLSQKLGPICQSSARFTLDDLEHYVETTGDKEPVKYLVSKHLVGHSEDEIKQQIEELQQRLQKAS